MSTVKNQSIADIHAGGEIGRMFATACRENYLSKVSTNSISAENCPEMVVFNLRKLRGYLDKIEKEFNEKQVPDSERGVAVMPMIYANEEKFNIMFVPCVQDEDQNIVHPLNKDTEKPEAFFDEWPPIWNHGSGMF